MCTYRTSAVAPFIEALCFPICASAPNRLREFALRTAPLLQHRSALLRQSAVGNMTDQRR